jgi:hypothetical protein
MVNKNFCKGIVAIVLLFGISSIGRADDIWSNVTSFSQLNGTWKLPSTVTLTMKEMLGEYWGSEMESLFGNMSVTVRSSNYTRTYNATAKTVLESGTQTMTYSGGNIDTVWPMLRESFNSQEYQELAVISINDANHTMSMTFNNYVRTLTDREITEFLKNFKVQINQDGRKMKYDGGIAIYTKQ